MSEKISIEINPEKMSKLVLTQRGLERLESEHAQIVKVRSKADNEAAAKFYSQVRAMWKAVEEERKPLAKSIDNSKKMLQGMFKPTLDKLEEIGKAVKGAMEEWAQKEMDRLAKEQAKIEKENQNKIEKYNEAAYNGEPLPSPVLKPAPADKPQAADGQSIRQVTKVQLIDIEQVPREYLMVDETKVRKAVNAGIKVPGFHIWKAAQVAAK